MNSYLRRLEKNREPQQLFRKHCRSKGYTLIEVLVAIGLVGLISGLVITVFIVVNNMHRKSLEIDELQKEGGEIMEKMSRVIRDGKQVEGSISGDKYVTVENYEDSLEYRQNNNCAKTTFRWIEPTADENGKIRKEYSGGCTASNEIITDDSVTKGVNITGLDFKITAYAFDKPQTVDITFNLGRAIKAIPNPPGTTISLHSRVSTRAY